MIEKQATGKQLRHTLRPVCTPQDDAGQEKLKDGDGCPDTDMEVRKSEMPIMHDEQFLYTDHLPSELVSG